MDDPLVRGFPTTRHSAIEDARGADAALRARGLSTLSSVYWRPVYAYLRLRWRRTHEEASDLAQEFFAGILENDLIARFDPRRARLRTWLRVCVDGLVSNHDKAARRQKRGSDLLHRADLDALRSEIEQLPASETPETLFEKEWARGVFALALARLKEECERRGKALHYALLEQHDLAADRPTYAELARRLGMTVTDVTNRLFRIRRELRRTVLEVLRELTSSDGEFREEARALLGSDGA